MLTDVGPRQDHTSSTDPGSFTDDHHLLGLSLHRDGDINSLVSVILIGDVHMVSCPYVIANVYSQVTNNSATTTDKTSIAYSNHRIRQANLSRNHSR